MRGTSEIPRTRAIRGSLPAMSDSFTDRFDAFGPVVLSVFRIIVGLGLLVHGTSKIFGYPAGPALDMSAGSPWWAGVIEVVVGALVALGLFTRPAAFLGSGTMAVAYFTAHAPDGLWPILNNGELAALYCFALFLLVFTGPGPIALLRR